MAFLILIKIPAVASRSTSFKSGSSLQSMVMLDTYHTELHVTCYTIYCYMLHVTDFNLGREIKGGLLTG